MHDVMQSMLMISHHEHAKWGTMTNTLGPHLLMMGECECLLIVGDGVRQALNALISVGNDGCINVRMIDNYNNDISKWEVTSLNLGNQHDGEVNDQNNTGNGKSMLQQRKITSLCIVHEEPTSAMIAVGTSCGQISLAKIIKSKDKIIHASVLDDKAIVEMENGEGSVVHSLCSKSYGDRCRIVAGHSAGLCVMDLETTT